MRRVIVSLLTASLVLAIVGCGRSESQAPPFSSGKDIVKVATSFYPLYEFARGVGGNHIDLVNIVPPGTEPHDWEPSSSHLKTLNQANILFFNGLGVDAWAEKVVGSLDNKQIKAVELSHGFDLMKADAAAGGDPGSGHDGGFDPHIWLDPQGAIHIVKGIRDTLIAQDAKHQAEYEANATAYIAKLTALDQAYKSGLSDCGKKAFFTSHAAFGYLAHRYNLEQVAIMGLAPDAEPKPQVLKDVVAAAKAKGIKHIFFETLVSDKVAKVVAQEIGAQTLVLNPFEGLTDEEIKAGKDYFSVMRENLTNLKIALECAK